MIFNPNILEIAHSQSQKFLDSISIFGRFADIINSKIKLEKYIAEQNYLIFKSFESLIR